MNRTTIGLMSLALLLGAVPLAGTATATTTPMAFGMEAGAIAAQTAAGVAPDYGTFWVGPWTLSSGWSGPDNQMANMAAQGVTPAIHFYYWGDDISPTCVENGCHSTLHNADLSRASWQALAQQLVDHINAKMAGKPVVIFVESEFNKGGISTYEPFDGYMADMMDFIHHGYPAAKTVLAYGNWGSSSWGTFDRAAAASDMVGLQGMRGSTKDSLTTYNGLYDATLAGVKTLQGLFHKPIILTDIALSSYPEPSYLAYQADNLAKFFANMPALKAAGVTAMIYRSWSDSPNMSLANYYGEAERHWGLAYTATSTKPATAVWVDGVKAERATAIVNLPPVAAFAASATGLTAAFDAAGSSDPEGAALTYAWEFGDGATAAGPKATHTYASTGTYTAKLTVSDGLLTASATRSLGVTAPVPTTTTTTTTSSTTTTSTAPFSASFTPSGGINEWWVDVKVTSASALSAVSATVNGGSPHALAKTSWGTYAASFNAPKGSAVVFTAKDAAGHTATAPKVAWMLSSATVTGTATGTTSGTSSTTTRSTTSTSSSTSATQSAFTATFSPKSVGNDWWVETGVTANKAITKVQVKINGAAAIELPKDSWGTYAKSINAPNNSKLVFVATASSGQTATSPTITWT